MSFDSYWRHQLGNLLLNGDEVAPRSQLTRELLHQSLAIDMRRSVLRAPNRKLSYQFMAAEAFWILSGDDRVATITSYNRRLAEFSDDGVTFFGAYGPKILGQLDYVITKLCADPLTRQAVLTIWRELPPPTKDTPCTVAISFSLREGKLNCHVFMRSSDLWLGLPYDVFNFSMLGHLVTARLNETRSLFLIEPGTLYLTAMSSHLYETNWDQAATCLNQRVKRQAPTPVFFYQDSLALLDALRELRSSKPGDAARWWEVDDATDEG